MCFWIHENFTSIDIHLIFKLFESIGVLINPICIERPPPQVYHEETFASDQYSTTMFIILSYILYKEIQIFFETMEARWIGVSPAAL